MGGRAKGRLSDLKFPKLIEKDKGVAS